MIGLSLGEMMTCGGHSSHLESQWQSAEMRASHHAAWLGFGPVFRLNPSCQVSNWNRNRKKSSHGGSAEV